MGSLRAGRILLAVYGQTYQTGADPYELFFGWAILIIGWVAISRFAPLWPLLLDTPEYQPDLVLDADLGYDRWTFCRNV